MLFRSRGWEPGWCQVDEAEVKIGDVAVKMNRRSKLDIPAEFSAFVPRVEIRRRYYANGQLVREEEMVLNSVTMVHTPRHLLPPRRVPEALSPPPPSCAPRLKISYGER